MPKKEGQLNNYNDVVQEKHIVCKYEMTSKGQQMFSLSLKQASQWSTVALLLILALGWFRGKMHERFGTCIRSMLIARPRNLHSNLSGIVPAAHMKRFAIRWFKRVLHNRYYHDSLPSPARWPNNWNLTLGSRRASLAGSGRVVRLAMVHLQEKVDDQVIRLLQVRIS